MPDILNVEEAAMPTAVPGRSGMLDLGLTLVHSRDLVKIAETPLTDGLTMLQLLGRGRSDTHLSLKVSDTPWLSNTYLSLKRLVL